MAAFETVWKQILLRRTTLAADRRPPTSALELAPQLLPSEILRLTDSLLSTDLLFKVFPDTCPGQLRAQNHCTAQSSVSTHGFQELEPSSLPFKLLVQHGALFSRLNCSLQ